MLMKVVDAYWEIRNLGVSTQEVEIGAKDLLDDIKRMINTLDAPYQVVKIPTTKVDVYSYLTQVGFTYVETMIRVSYDINHISCSGIVDRLSKQMSYEEMNDDDIMIMNSQIDAGMFKTDRIILDPHFNSKQAANRYKLWMRDELSRGSRLFVYKYKDQPVGFSCMRTEEGNVI